MFQHDILADDQAVRSHLFQRRQNPAYMFVCVHESNDHRQLASSLNQASSFDPMAAEKRAIEAQEGGGGRRRGGGGGDREGGWGGERQAEPAKA